MRPRRRRNFVSLFNVDRTSRRYWTYHHPVRLSTAFRFSSFFGEFISDLPFPRDNRDATKRETWMTTRLNWLKSKFVDVLESDKTLCIINARSVLLMRPKWMKTRREVSRAVSSSWRGNDDLGEEFLFIGFLWSFEMREWFVRDVMQISEIF